MKAYLKTNPSRVGKIAYVYTTDFGQKRITMWLEDEEGVETGSIDAAADEFEVIYEDGEQ